jgi:hypothetical protein
MCWHPCVAGEREHEWPERRRRSLRRQTRLKVRWSFCQLRPSRPTWYCRRAVCSSVMVECLSRVGGGHLSGNCSSALLAHRLPKSVKTIFRVRALHWRSSTEWSFQMAFATSAPEPQPYRSTTDPLRLGSDLLSCGLSTLPSPVMMAGTQIPFAQCDHHRHGRLLLLHGRMEHRPPRIGRT